MLSITSIITDINEIPREWVFEHYLKLDVRLMGQDVKIKSLFNPVDKNPSMYIFFSSNNTYRYKDFSTGKTGDALDLVKEMFKLGTRGETAHKIIQDYSEFIKNNKGTYDIHEFKKRNKFKVTDFTTRAWTNLDERFWTKFFIGSKILDFFNVVPLNDYTLQKEEDGTTRELIIKGNNLYGYFRKDGALYKIYNPYSKENKFIKVKDYIQGSDQLTMAVPYLIICSSLKDVMAFTKLGYKNAEAVAPDSENIIIPEHVITAYKLKYKNICTLFDNDKAGKESMQKYKSKYGLNSVTLELSKDLSDSLRDFKLHKTKEVLTPLLKQALQ